LEFIGISQSAVNPAVILFARVRRQSGRIAGISGSIPGGDISE